MKNRNRWAKTKAYLESNVLNVSTFIAISIVFVVGIIWMVPSAQLIPDLQLDDNTPYLLSAVSQSLAAIIALVFTISILVTELSSRYSQRVLGGPFDWFTVFYVIIFIGAIALPFWLLAYTSLHAVKLSLLLTTICLLLLPLHFLRIRNKVSPESILSALRKQAVNQMTANPSRMPEAIQIIDNMIMSASNMKDYLTIRRGVTVLADLMYKAHDMESKKPSEILNEDLFSIDLEIRKELEEIAITTIDDPRAIEIVPAVLVHQGTSACERGLWEYAYSIHVCLVTIAYDAVAKGSDDLAREATSLAALLYRHFYEHIDYEQVHDAIITFRGIGKEAINKSLSATLDTAISVLGQIGERAAIKRFHESVSNASSSIEYLVDESNTKNVAVDTNSAARWIINIGAIVSTARKVKLRKQLAQKLDSVLRGLSAESREAVYSRVLRFPSRVPFDRSKSLKSFIRYYKSRAWQSNSTKQTDG